MTMVRGRALITKHKVYPGKWLKPYWPCILNYPIQRAGLFPNTSSIPLSLDTDDKSAKHRILLSKWTLSCSIFYPTPRKNLSSYRGLLVALLPVQADAYPLGVSRRNSSNADHISRVI
jgi:hypothetical protein